MTYSYDDLAAIAAPYATQLIFSDSYYRTDPDKAVWPVKTATRTLVVCSLAQRDGERFNHAMRRLVHNGIEATQSDMDCVQDFCTKHIPLKGAAGGPG